MSNGIIIVENGADVDTAADYQKSLDSRDKFLEIADERILDVSIGGDPVIKLFDHDLGYLPLFTFKLISQSSNADINFYDQALYATTTGIYADNFLVPSDYICFIRVFKLDVTANYSAPSTHPSIGTTDSSPVGVKILDIHQGQSIASRNKSGFTLNTSAKAISIHKHGTISVDTTGKIVITHTIGYPPTFFISPIQTIPGGFGILNGQRTVREFGSQLGLGSANGSTIIISGAQGVLGVGDYAYIILKDPVEVAK